MKVDKQNKCSKATQRAVEYLINLMETEGVLYAALTGVSFSRATRNFQNVNGVNNIAVGDITHATSSIVAVGRFVITVVVVVVEQFLEQYLVPDSGAFQFRLTPIACCVTFSLIISGMVMNVIQTINSSLILVYNYLQRQNIEQNTDVMPKTFKSMIEQYNLISRKHKFSWKPTI